MRRQHQAVIVDIDDTIADTQAAIIDFIFRRTGERVPLGYFTEAVRRSRSGEYDGLVTEFLSTPEAVRDVAPLADARQALERLHAGGYRVHIMSSRAEPLHHVTEKWLKDNGFADSVHEIHPRPVSEPSSEYKRRLADRLKPAAIFEDAYDIAASLASAGITSYLITRPWNESRTKLPGGVTRVDSFSEGVERFLGAARSQSKPPRN